MTPVGDWSETRHFTMAPTVVLVNRILAAGSGSFLKTGTAATLSYAPSKSLVAGSGAFIRTGTSAGLLHKKNIIPATESIDVTGTDVAFFEGYGLLPETAVFDVIGTDLSLKKNCILDIGSGSFLVQDPSTIIVQPSLIAESGSFVVSRNDTALYPITFGHRGETRMKFVFKKKKECFQVKNEGGGNT